MDVLPAIWLSSISSAVFFFSGGRLWGKFHEEGEVAAAQKEAEAEIQTLSETVRQQKLEAIAQRARIDDLETALAGERASADELEGRLARALERSLLASETEAALRQEAAMLSGELQGARSERAAAEARLETLRVELSALRQRADETARLKAENAALRKRLDERAKTAEAAPARPVAEAQPKVGQKLEEALSEQLEALRRLDGGCRTVVLSDMSGLIIASSGDTARDDDLAVAASLASDAPARLRELLPFGDPLEIRLVDVNDAVFTARWLRGEHDALLLSTFGAATAKADPQATAIRAAVSRLLCWK